MLNALLNTLPQIGRVRWIGLRPGRRLPLNAVDEVIATVDAGLEGDRYSGRSGDRQVTFIQFEHLAAIESLLGLDRVEPSRLRRNIAVSGLNLLALKQKRFTVGSVQMEYTGQCHPCSRMEEALGPGGYNAMRGHGGITARVVCDGMISLNDEVRISQT